MRAELLLPNVQVEFPPNAAYYMASAGLRSASVATFPRAYKICLGADPEGDRGLLHSAPPYTL